MLKIAICDDEQEHLDIIQNFAEKWGKQHGEEFRFFPFHDAPSLLANFRDDFDILFLDIQMSGMSGLEAARHLRGRGKNICIIFITSNSGYSIQCFRVRAFSFLTKPLVYDEFRMEFSDAVKMVKNNQKNSIIIKTNDGSRKITVSDILYAEVSNHTVQYRMTDGSLITCRDTLKNVSESLAEYGFIMCHSAYLVNVSRIRKITASDVIMEDDSVISISKHRKAQFMKEVMQYMGERMG